MRHPKLTDNVNPNSTETHYWARESAATGMSRRHILALAAISVILAAIVCLIGLFAPAIRHGFSGPNAAEVQAMTQVGDGAELAAQGFAPVEFMWDEPFKREVRWTNCAHPGFTPACNKETRAGSGQVVYTTATYSRTGHELEKVKITHVAYIGDEKANGRTEWRICDMTKQDYPCQEVIL